MTTIRMLFCMFIFAITLLPFKAAADGDRHGSIAFSQESDGSYAWGMAWSWDNRSAATAVALEQCRVEGGVDCTEVGWFSNACGALAIGSGNGFGSGWGDSIETAQQDALSKCESVNEDCRIVGSRCAAAEEDETDGMQSEAPIPSTGVEPLFVSFAHSWPACNAWGIAWSTDSPQAALDAAIAECNARGGDGCLDPHPYFYGPRPGHRKACAAVVYIPPYDVFNCRLSRYAGDSTEEAEKAALSRCESLGVNNCRILETRCVVRE